MAIFLDEDRAALRDGLDRLLADHGGEAAVRTAMESSAGYDPDLWRRLAEMGIVGLIVDEAHGGSGAGPVELETVMESAGAALLCGPFLASGVVAAALLAALGDDDAAARHLPGMAAGTTIATVALTGDQGLWTPEAVGVRASRAGDGWALDGVASYVLHGQNADVIFVVATGPDGLAAFEVDPRAAGLDVKALPTFDHTLRLARMTFAATPARRLAATVPVWDAVRRAMDLALVALAGEQAGGARRVLDSTTDYARTRVQFGRAIGSFQAIKHMAADLLLETESATSAARHAAARLAQNASDAAAAISLAAFACADAFTAVTAASIQMHGGIAFTWVHPAHLYLRRARADAQMFGTPSVHRERYLQALGALS